jgi:hypothetical protein
MRLSLRIPSQVALHALRPRKDLFNMSANGSLIAFTGINPTNPLHQPIHVAQTSDPTTVSPFGHIGLYGAIAVNNDGSAIASVVTDFSASDP